MEAKEILNQIPEKGIDLYEITTYKTECNSEILRFAKKNVSVLCSEIKSVKINDGWIDIQTKGCSGILFSCNSDSFLVNIMA